MPHVARLGRQLGVGVHGQGQVAHDVAYGLDAVGKDVHGQVGCLGGDLDGGILGHEERLAFVGGEVAAVQAEAEAALAAQHQAQAAYAVRVAQGGREGGKGAFGTQMRWLVLSACSSLWRRSSSFMGRFIMVIRG